MVSTPVMNDQPASAVSPAGETSLVYAHSLAAIVTLLISICFGVLASIEMLVPDLIGNTSWLTWGRLRYDHTQGIMFGWLGNAFFAFLYHGVPVLTGKRVTSLRLGQWIFGLWNFAVVAPGWILVLARFSHAPSHLYPRPMHARFLAPVFSLPSQWHPSLRLSRDPHERADRSDHGLHAARRGRDSGGRQSALIAARRGTDPARYRLALCRHR